MRRFRRSSRRSSGSRRRKVWGASLGFLHENPVTWNNAITPQILIADNMWHKVPANTFNTLAGESEPTDYTLVRTLPSWHIGVRFEAASGAALTMLQLRWSFGLIAWDATSDSVVPIADMPVPGVDNSFDWIYQSTISDEFISTASTQIALGYSAPRFGFQAESRAKRKLSAGTGILACWCLALDYASFTYNNTVRVLFGQQTRSLFLEP